MLQVWYQSLKDDKKYENIKIIFLLTCQFSNIIGIEITYRFLLIKGIYHFDTI